MLEIGLFYKMHTFRRTLYQLLQIIIITVFFSK